MSAMLSFGKKLGFGFMRLPMQDGQIDFEHVCNMVDKFLGNGFRYFDTAHGYHDGDSELAIKRCLTSRYKRDDYFLTNKLTADYFHTQDDIRPFFENQLKWCGVDYFDVYLMHAQDRQIFEYFKKNNAYETALELKQEGKIKHFGISFHDTAQVLEQILNEYPQIEIVQIQLNYLDYEDPAVQSKKCYDVCVKYNKPVVIMEPIKGGNLINLPPEALELVKNANVRPANLALRFAASPKNVAMVLSGMSNIEQLSDNISFMKEFEPLSQDEQLLTKKIAEIIHAKNMIPCTACRYCVAGCPKRISIPDLFACLNAKKHFNDWNAGFYYGIHTAKEHSKASACIKCGKCEKVCPQHLKIRKLLEDVAKEFED